MVRWLILTLMLPILTCTLFLLLILSCLHVLTCGVEKASVGLIGLTDWVKTMTRPPSQF